MKNQSIMFPALLSMTGIDDMRFDNKQTDESSYVSCNNRTDEESVHKSNSADNKRNGFKL